MELEDYRQGPKKLLAKYRNHYTGDSLFIYDEQGELLLGKPGVDAEDLEVLAQATDPQLAGRSHTAWITVLAGAVH